MDVKEKWADVRANKDFIFVQTLSGNGVALPDPLGNKFFLSHSSTDDELGQSLLEALAMSRLIDPEADPGFFDFRGRSANEYNEWVAATMRKFSYKRKTALFGRMRFCSVGVVGDVMTIYPSHHERGDAWSGEGLTEEDNVILAFNSSPSEVGAALRLALERCRGNVY